ncbi:hypothetical protein VTK56DRAFT_7541 [Thermocarpiscus australiensis]
MPDSGESDTNVPSEHLTTPNDGELPCPADFGMHPLPGSHAPAQESSCRAGALGEPYMRFDRILPDPGHVGPASSPTDGVMENNPTGNGHEESSEPVACDTEVENLDGITDRDSSQTDIDNMHTEDNNSDDDELFVRQPGEVQMVNSFIDLTQETENESNARALRVSLIKDEIDLTNFDDSEYGSQDSDSEYMDDTDDTTGDERPVRRRRPRNQAKVKREAPTKRTSGAEMSPEPDNQDVIEDLIDGQDMLAIEQQMLQRRRDKGNLSPTQAKRLEALNREATELELKIQELMSLQEEPESATADDADGPESFSSDNTNHNGQLGTSSLAAPSAASRRKRKSTEHPTVEGHKKKPKRIKSGTASVREYQTDPRDASER